MLEEKNNHQPPHPRGIIFDCDGTLADSMPLHWRAWQVISLRHGFSLSEERFYSLGGVPARDILKMLSAEQGLVLDSADGGTGKGRGVSFAHRRGGANQHGGRGRP